MPDLIDWNHIHQEINYLRLEIDRQQKYIDQLRRHLPRGWYRRSNIAAELKIVPTPRSSSSNAELPMFWQLLGLR